MSAPDIAAWTAQLAAYGYCVIPDLVSPAQVAAIDGDLGADFAATPFGQGHFYGYRTQRFGSLLRRSAHVEALVLEPTVLAIAHAFLDAACDRIQLNVAQAIAVHPGEVAQFPHSDHDMWAGSKGGHEYLVNVIWPLVPFTGNNGATRFYPGTHHAPPAALEDLPEPVVAQCSPGSAICFLGSTVHGAGANSSGDVRRCVVIGYSLGWLKPYENLWLAYPPDVARTFSPELAALAGYCQHRPNLGNFEGQCPSILLQDAMPAHLGAIDALRPDQAALLEQFAQETRRS